MNLNHLAIFHAVALEGSISRAADRLLTSQPAVSKQLKILERSMKALLVDRLPRGVRLTAAGELLEKYARDIFAISAQAERAMEELRGARRGCLAVGATTTIGVYRLPPLLVQYRKMFPDIDVRMEIHPTPAVAAAVAAGSLDLGLVESKPDESEVDATVFDSDELIAIAAPGHPLARKRSVSLRQFVESPFVVRGLGSGTQSLVESWVREQGLSIKIAMSLGSTEAIKWAVAGGTGVAVVSRSAVAAELAVRRLLQIRVAGLSLRRPLYLVLSRRRSRSIAVARFLDALKSANR